MIRGPVVRLPGCLGLRKTDFVGFLDVRSHARQTILPSREVEPRVENTQYQLLSEGSFGDGFHCTEDRGTYVDIVE